MLPWYYMRYYAFTQWCATRRDSVKFTHAERIRTTDLQLLEM